MSWVRCSGWSVWNPCVNVGVHWNETRQLLASVQTEWAVQALSCPHGVITVHLVQTEQAVQVQPHVLPVHGVHAVHWHVNSSAQAVWIVQLQLAVNAQPCVFSTQSSVTPPQLVMSWQPPGPSPTLIMRSLTRKRGTGPPSGAPNLRPSLTVVKPATLRHANRAGRKSA